MKNKYSLLSIVLLSALIVLLVSCKKSDDDSDTSGTRSASFKIAGTSYTVTKHYIGIFNDNGTIDNTMTLTATDGSMIEFNFTGSSPATYTLQSYSDAYYKNTAGKQYNSTSGELIVTSYTIGDFYVATGTFHFKAKAIAAPIDSLEITDGVFTNASNEF